MSRPAIAALCLLVLGCTSQPSEVPESPGDEGLVAVEGSRYGPYPKRWWASVSTEGAPAWEILPQAAEPPVVILSKRHELGILSNFAPTAFTFAGERYASLEGFWQCMKYPEGPEDPRSAASWKHTRAEVRAMTAFEAHAAGVAAEANMKELGIDWVSFGGERIAYKGAGVERHFALIVAATWAKLSQNAKVQEVLRSTGDLELRADHHEDADGTKAWGYYRIYMELRDVLHERGWEPKALQELAAQAEARAIQPAEAVEPPR